MYTETCKKYTMTREKWMVFSDSLTLWTDNSSPPMVSRLSYVTRQSTTHDGELKLAISVI